MKKILSFIIIAVLCLGVLSSCDVINGLINPHTHNYVGGVCECGEVDPNATFYPERAAEYIVTQYNKVNSVTPSDYEVYGQVRVGGVVYTVDWSVDNELVKLVDNGSTWLVNVDEKSESEQKYKLTGLITAPDGTTATVNFDRSVPVYKELSHEDFLNTKDGDPVVIQGVISGIVETSKENDLYIQGEEGGYFVFAMEKKPSELGLKIGMTVKVSGLRDTYYDVPQVTNGSVEIVSEEITTVTPIDITSVFANAENTDFKNFADYANMFVTIKGVTVLGQDASNDSYYNFSLAGKTSYVRISSSTSMLSSEDDAAFKKNVADHINYTADVTGMVVSYNNKVYLVPVDANAFANFTLPERSDAEKLESELGGIKIPSEVRKDTEISLPVVGGTYDAVKFSWASNNACAVISEDGSKLVITLPEEAATATLTLTAKIGEITETKTYEIAVFAKPKTVNVIVDTPVNGQEYYLMLTQENLGMDLFFNGEMDGYYYATTDDVNSAVKIKVIALADGKYDLMLGEKYLGIIHTSEGYINVKILDEAPAGKFVWNTEYKTFTTDIEGKGTYYLGTYSTYKTISASTIDKAATSYVAHLVLVKPDSDGQVNLTDSAMGLGAYAEGNVEVEGFGFGFTEIGTYGNGIQMRIKEGRVASIWNTTEFTYGIAKIELVFNSEKSTYDNADAFAFYFGNDSEVSGYTVKLSTVKDQKVYTIVPDKDTYTYFKMELLLTYTFYWDEINIVLTNYEEEPHTCVFEAATCTKPATCSCGATQGEALGHTINEETHICTVCGVDDPEYYWSMTIPEALAANKGKLVTISGKVVEIKEAWSSYNNMSVYIEDEDGNKIYVYRTKTQVNLGDVITVSGKVDEYSGAKQIGSGSTATVDVAHTCSEWNDATCTAPKTCKFCGKTEGEKLDHTYGEDGKCECGASAPVTGETVVTLTYPKCDTTTNVNGTDNWAATLGLDETLFTVSADCCGNTTFPGLNKAGEIRMYASAIDKGGKPGDGSEISVAIGNGKTIKSITITFTSANYASSCQISSGENVIVTTDGTTTTVTVSINAASFVIKNVGTAQVRFSSVEITYA